MTDNPTTPEAAERARFEAWAKSETPLCLDRARDGSDMYADEDTDFAWLVWNAALAAQEGGGERVTTLAPEEFNRVVEFCESEPLPTEELKSLYRRYLDWKSAAQEGTGNG